ncbi:MAG: hypothetical protein CMC96_07540 [Flavobacteriales bacterium]|nr:hypothetical protein [Flavobacteriales bacterium]|tara:strand:- start:44265 stop:45302 length:1038 start_codon:yes stop_codon:yes gene_type:complete
MKNFIGLIVVLVLGGIAYWMYSSKDKPVNTEVYKDFAIEDTAKVDKVFITQANGKSVTISRRGFDEWMIEGEFPARKDAIQLILKTLHDISIQAPVSKETFDWVVKSIAGNHTKVEFYLEGKDEPEKVWYIGEPTASRVGTYMLLEKDGKKSAKPFITHLLMERGYLGTRFFTDKTLWKDRIVMRCNPREIRRIEVKHQSDTLGDFSIEQYEKDRFRLTDLSNNQSQELNPELAIPYFKLFSGVYYEYVDKKTPSEQLDSIYLSPERHNIKLELMDGKTIEMRAYNMPVREGATLNGKLLTHHPERMYVYSSYLGEEEHPIVQNLTFDPLVPGIKEFTSLTTVEK